ncbi:MAG: DUF1080 domain-containing protein [Halioglobus sp.]|nr:DUF1080 domain-containing protein [Halioglobus sp.]
MTNCRYLLLALLVAAGGTLADDGWRPLVDDSNFLDWTVEGASKAAFSIQDNVVIGHPVGFNPKNSFLCSPRQYKDFELAFSFRISDPIMNSGVQFRSIPHAEGVRGPQFEMDVAEMADKGWLRRILEPVYNFFTGRIAFDWSTAGIYGEGMDTGWIYPGVAGGDVAAFEAQGGRLTQQSGWNEVRLRAEGPRIQTWLAGEARADFTYEPVDKPGRICLQVHGGNYRAPEKLFIEWRDLRIREL